MNDLELKSADVTDMLRQYPTYRNINTATKIDHAYVSNTNNIQMMTYHRGPHFVTDHAALILSLKLSTTNSPVSRWSPALKQIRKTRYDPTDPQHRKEAAQRLNSIPVQSEGSAEDRLLHYAAVTKEHINELTHAHKPHRHKVCKYWCPDNVALELFLQLAQRLYHVTQRNKSTTVQRYADIITQTEQRLLHLAKQSTAQYNHFQQLTTFSIPFWQLLQFDTHIAQWTTIASQSIKKLLYHGLRKQRRQEFTALQKKLSINVQVGRIRPAIQYAIGSKKRSFQLETLRTSSEVLTDPGDITYTTKAHFDQWFTPSQPKTMDEWHNILTDENAFFTHSRAMNVPDPNAQII